MRVNRKQDSVRRQRKVSGQAGERSREELGGNAGDLGIHISLSTHFLLSSHFGFHIVYATLYYLHLVGINRTITMV